MTVCRCVGFDYPNTQQGCTSGRPVLSSSHSRISDSGTPAPLAGRGRAGVVVVVIVVVVVVVEVVVAEAVGLGGAAVVGGSDVFSVLVDSGVPQQGVTTGLEVDVTTNTSGSSGSTAASAWSTAPAGSFWSAEPTWPARSTWRIGLIWSPGSTLST